MRILKRILAGIVILVAAFFLAAYLFPRQVQVERSITVAAEPAAIFPHVNSLKATEAWSPWLSRDPETRITYAGPDAGTGAAMEWVSEHPYVGSGKQTITESVDNARVVMALDFGAQGTAVATFTLTPTNGGTMVTWGFDTDMGPNPMGRWLGLMMDSWVGGDYEAGLANLKALVEG